MGFSSFWPLALLALIPVIILLYILKQNAKPHPFSSTMLWQEVYRNIEATKPWEKLRKSLLMFLQILTVLCFIFALMNPWLKALGSEGAQVILVLDTSASMDTLFDGEQTRLEAAKEAACDYVDSLSSDTTIYVISSDEQAVLVLSNSKDKLEAKDRIRSLEQSSLAGDLSVSLGLVQSCASQSEDAQILFFTDTAFDMGDLNASVESFYSEVENVSVDSVSYGVREEEMVVLVSLTNYAQEDLSREVNLYGQNESGEEKLLDIVSVELSAGESVSVYFNLDSSEMEQIQILRAELNEQDALSGDNEAWCVLQEVQTNQVLLVTQSNLFVEKAFSNLAGIELYRTSDLGTLETGTDYDLYIFDGILPEELPAVGSLLFINCEPEGILENCGQAEGVLLYFVDSEVTTYIEDASFGVNATALYTVPSWGTGFLQTGGDYAGIYGICDGQRMAVLGFDLHDTDFVLQAEFPILISNLSEYLLESGLTEQTSYTAGDSVVLHGSTKGSDLTLTLPDESSQTVSAGESSGYYLEVKTTGVYQVSQEINYTVRQQKFTVGFPTDQESSVESAESMTADGESGSLVQSSMSTLAIRNYILLALLLLMMIEWIVYIRIQ